MKKNIFHVLSNGNIEIPFTFIPKGVMKYNAILNITTETGLCFSYPLTVINIYIRITNSTIY